MTVAKPNEIRPLITHGVSRKYLIFGDRMVLTMSELPPGARWTRSVHPEEEIVYVLKGRLHYDDGRVVREGEATINLANQDHPGRIGEEPCVILEVYAPSVEQWKSSVLLDILKQYFSQST